jgi:hypothetical protein
MLNRLFSVIVTFWVVVMLLSCGRQGNAPSVECAGVHYCLNALIDQRLDAYAQSGAVVNKYVYLNGKQEQQVVTLDAARWEAEFTAFREADIDKPALNGKYLVDTLFVETDSFTRVSYIAQDDKLRTRYIHLYFQPGQPEPSYIEARLETKNIFYQSVQELEFYPGNYYSIKGFQDIWLLGVDSFAVRSTFVN